MIVTRKILPFCMLVGALEALSGCGPQFHDAAMNTSVHTSPTNISADQQGRPVRKPLPAVTPTQNQRTEATLAQSTPLNKNVIALGEELERRQARVHNISARMKVKYTGADGKSINLNGVCMGTDAGDLRLRLTGPFNILALDLSIENERMSCWIPSRKNAQRGSREDIMEKGDPEMAFIASLGTACDLFFPALGSHDSVQQDNGITWVYGWDQTGGFVRSSAVDLTSRSVKRQDIFSKQGDLFGTVDYGSFGKLGAFAESPVSPADGALPIPISFRLADSKGQMRMDVTLDRISINKPITKTSFRLDFPQGQQIREVGDEVGRLAAR